jgi:hypothetical protein
MGKAVLEDPSEAVEAAAYEVEEDDVSDDDLVPTDIAV